MTDAAWGRKKNSPAQHRYNARNGITASTPARRVHKKWIGKGAKPKVSK